MTTIETRQKINTIVEHLPDEVLINVLDYLQTVSQQPQPKVQVSTFLRKILEEDKELLEKLAQ